MEKRWKKTQNQNRAAIGALGCGHHVIPFPFFISTSVPERPSWTFEPKVAVPWSGQAWPHSNSLVSEFDEGFDQKAS